MIVPAGDLRPKAIGRIGLPCPSTTCRGGHVTQAPRDKNLAEPLEARTTASPSRLPWAETAAEVTPCCPPPGDHCGSIPQGSSPLPQIQIHAIDQQPLPGGMPPGRKLLDVVVSSCRTLKTQLSLSLRIACFLDCLLPNQNHVKVAFNHNVHALEPGHLLAPEGEKLLVLLRFTLVIHQLVDGYPVIDRESLGTCARPSWRTVNPMVNA
jgi:hypothetical protein